MDKSSFVQALDNIIKSQTVFINTCNKWKLGQDLISLGLKIQKHEVPLDYVLNKINISALEEINNSTDWEKDVTTVGKISALMEIQAITQSDLARELKVSRQW